MDYHQPNFYRFSQDSLELVSSVEEIMRHQKHLPLKVLDLCAGCGVVGLETQLRFPNWRIEYCELQASFFSYFEQNFALVFPSHVFNSSSYKVMNMRDLKIETLEDRYDLILSNPPYFSPESGRLPSSQERRLCRFFSKEEWRDFLSCLERSLKPQGQAFFLARENLWEKDDRISVVETLAGAQLFRFHLNIERNEEFS